MKEFPGSVQRCYQELYMLYFVEGYSQDEIAKMKGVSQNTISKKIRRITKQLTEMCRKAE